MVTKHVNEKIYMQLPHGFARSNTCTVCRLKKSLYGLKQASCQWNLKRTTTFPDAGYVQSKYDYFLFTKGVGSRKVFLLVYVDDLLLTGSNDVLIQELNSVLLRNFKLKDLGILSYFLVLRSLDWKRGL